ncbi:hypothetical protein T265_06713 [Opisthorchis viverrini]|uniref:Uncharacterized protein n=1 Tax=Opisthorchis viverrini TaxID=6198 RepID=A0A074ZJJ5_OPIVI|nr:hypothetical protein T265_06713 [Opisthorchis viverrini]KER25962.1 hypothetical protein T265_06713 [Opisthorchis viverrini]
MCWQLSMGDRVEYITDTFGTGSDKKPSTLERVGLDDIVCHSGGASPRGGLPYETEPNLQVSEVCKRGRADCCSEKISIAQSKLPIVIPETPPKNNTKDPCRKHSAAAPLSQGHFGSSPSENSLGYSGAEYDSGAQDLSEEPRSLHLLLRSEHPDLYHMFFPAPPQSGSVPTSHLTSPAHQDVHESKKQNPNPMSSEGYHSEPAAVNWTQATSETSSTTEASTYSPDLVRRLFECANVVHMQHTGRLRSELLDLTHRLQGLQASRDFGLREIQRVKRERDQIRNQLANQAARYEDRLTELHSVIAELRRRLQHVGVNLIREVDEFQEEDEVEEVASTERQVFNFTQIKKAPDFEITSQTPTHLPVRDSSADGEDASSDGSTDGDTSIGAVDGDHLDSGDISKSLLQNTVDSLHLSPTSLPHDQCCRLSKSISHLEIAVSMENRNTVGYTEYIHYTSLDVIHCIFGSFFPSYCVHLEVHSDSPILLCTAKCKLYDGFVRCKCQVTEPDPMDRPFSDLVMVVLSYTDTIFRCVSVSLQSTNLHLFTNANNTNRDNASDFGNTHIQWNGDISLVKVTGRYIGPVMCPRISPSMLNFCLQFRKVVCYSMRISFIRCSAALLCCVNVLS